MVYNRIDDESVQNRSDSFAAIFDGHGGRETVDFVSKALPKNLANLLKKHGHQSENLLRILRTSFLLTDIQTKTYVKDVSGSTGVCCLLRKEKNNEVTAYIANCGDSRLVICEIENEEEKNDKNGIGIHANRLSFDHVSDEKYELNRIQTSKGFVQHGRTCGVLAVARSFGDHEFKKYVTSEPALISYKINNNNKNNKKTNPFLIMACDGIWDVMSDNECIEMILEMMQSLKDDKDDSSSKQIDEKEIAQRIVKEAETRGTSDNLSVIVIFF